MDKLDKYIDEMFHEKFSGVGESAAMPGNDWLKLRKVIRKKNFLRFSPASFNIYYLAAIVVGVVSVGTIVFSPFQNKIENSNITPTPLMENIDSCLSADSIPSQGDSVQFLSVPENKKCIESKVECTSDKKCTESDKVTEEKKKTENVDVESQSKSDQNKNIEHQKTTVKMEADSIIYEIAPSDTVISIDTIRIKKKKVQFSRKKN